MERKRRALPLLVAVLLIGGLFFPQSANAHGPCYCLSPSAATPGTIVRVPGSYGAVEALWNPDPSELSNPALVGSPWARHFDPKLDTLSLARQEKPGPISFTVPRVPDGKYLVVIFDLSEGGPRHHYTWSTFTVRRAGALPFTGFATIPWLAINMMFLAIGLLLLMPQRPRSYRRRTFGPARASHR